MRLSVFLVLRRTVQRAVGLLVVSAPRVEVATAEWVDRCNHSRIHGETGPIPPAEYEANYYLATTEPQIITTN